MPAVLPILPVPVAPPIQQPENPDQGIRESESNFFEIPHRVVPGVESVAAEIEVSLTEAAQPEVPKSQATGQVEQQQSDAQV